MTSPDKKSFGIQMHAGLKSAGMWPFLTEESIPALQHMIKCLGNTRLEQEVGQKWAEGDSSVRQAPRGPSLR